MNYAKISDQPFSTHKAVLTSKKLPVNAQSIRMFCRTHSVSITVNPETKEGYVTLTTSEA